MNKQEESWNWIGYSLGGFVAAVVVLALLEVLSRYVLHYSFFLSEDACGGR
jgi:TRAP-type C4-dicarboxylate transport system permease small subunit